MNRKLIVVEANEIPIRVFREFADRRPRSTIARLLNSSMVLETIADDVPYKFLWPAQTWASLNTGVPFKKHNVHWFNDPKPEEYPLYWQILAKKEIPIGIVGSPHTSHALQNGSASAIKFLIPDCFAETPTTKPRRFTPFQKMNLKQTRANRRIANLPALLGPDALSLLHDLPTLGLSVPTLRDVANTLFGIATRKTSSERIRNVQFTLLKDLFLNCLQTHDVSLGVVFTNHVAANMHRYWYALFPKDYEYPVFGESWIRKHRDDVLHAVALLDDALKQLVRWCEDNGAALLILSSMGQRAVSNLKEPPTHQVVVDSLPSLLDRVGIDRRRLEPIGGMEPQYGFKFPTEEEAESASRTFSEAGTPQLHFEPELRQNTVTISLRADPKCQAYILKGKTYSDTELGLKRIPLSDTSTAYHQPEGTLICFRSETASASSKQVNYLEIAPAICRYFSVSPAGYMRTPSFTL